MATIYGTALRMRESRRIFDVELEKDEATAKALVAQQNEYAAGLERDGGRSYEWVVVKIIPVENADG